MEVKIFRVDRALPLPKFESAGAAAFDLLARENCSVAPRALARIPANVILQCPENLALFLLPRSSLFAKKKLIFPHSIGLIDRDFCGPRDEIQIQVLNFSDEKVEIFRGEKLAQAIFLRTEKINFREIFEIKKNSRGGFGSTDKKNF